MRFDPKVFFNRYISANFELVDWFFVKTKCFTQMGLSLPVPVSSPWTIQDHSFLLIGAGEPIRYRVRNRHWCSQTNQIQGENSSLVQPSQSESRFSLFLKHPRPFLSSDWCIRTNQIQGENTLLWCSRTSQIQRENLSNQSDTG
jgi:hypothetical protein